MQGEKLRVVRLDRFQQGFWSVLGPFATSREVLRETGEKYVVVNGDVWFAAYFGDLVVAVACLRRTGKETGRLVHDYTRPSFRRRGVHATLIQERVRDAEKSGILRLHAVASAAALSGFLGAGFRVVGRKGRFYRVCRP